MLTLVRASKNDYDQWSDDDFVVFDDGLCIGHIMRTRNAPQGRPWFWTIVSGGPHDTDNRGYAEHRAQATAELKARWLRNIEAATLAPR